MAIEEVGARLSLKDRPAFSRGLRDVESDIDRVGHSADRAGRHFSTLGTLAGGARGAVSLVGSVSRTAVIGVAALGTAAIATGGHLINLASDAAEVQSKFDTVFGTAGADQVSAWIRDIQGEVHIATDELQNAASTFGVFGQAAGVPASDLATFSTALAAAGLDLASFSNASPEDVFLALRSGLAGESEPLRQFGIFLSDASLNAFAAAEGIGKTTAEMTEQEKVMLRQRFILANLGAAQGDLDRTSEGVANQQRSLLGTFRDIRVELGEALLPAVETLLPVLTNGLEGVLNRLRDNLPNLQERTRHWAQMLVRLYRTIRDGRIDTEGFDTQIEAVFGTRFGGFLNDAIDMVRNLKTNIGELGTQAGVSATVESLFGAGAAEFVDTLWTALENLGIVFRESVVPAWEAAQEVLGPAAGLAFEVFTDLLGLAAENTEALIPWLEAFFIVWTGTKVVGAISNILGMGRALFGLTGAMGVSGAAATGGRGLIASFLASPAAPALATAGTAVVVGAHVWEGVEHMASGEPWRDEVTGERLEPTVSPSGSGENPLPSTSVPMAGVPSVLPSQAAAPTSAIPFRSSHPVGGGAQEFAGVNVVIQAWDGEDVQRALRDNPRPLIEAVERGLQINRSRG